MFVKTAVKEVTSDLKVKVVALEDVVISLHLELVYSLVDCQEMLLLSR
jgi:hypothetical protein